VEVGEAGVGVEFDGVLIFLFTHFSFYQEKEKWEIIYLKSIF
jgi:hypothetical protein